MISRSHDYVEYCRETALHLKTLHDLALRGAGKEEVTAAIHRQSRSSTAVGKPSPTSIADAASRTSVGMAHRMVYGKLTGRPMVIQKGTQVSFYATAEEFPDLARDVGITPARHWRHDHPDTRNNFLFTKAEG